MSQQPPTGPQMGSTGQYPSPGQPGQPGQPDRPTNRREAKAQARAAKAYAKAQRPFYAKKRYILPVGLIVLIVIIVIASNSGGGGGSGSSKTTASKACTASYPDKQSSDICADASGTVTISGVAVTATPLAAASDVTGSPILCSNVTIKNNSSKSQDYNVLDFKIQTPSGNVSTGSTLNLGSTLNSGTLVAGGTTAGKVCTDNKTGEKGAFVLIYKPSVFNSTRGTWLTTI
jgi:hypothetical protein